MSARAKKTAQQIVGLGTFHATMPGVNYGYRLSPPATAHTLQVWQGRAWTTLGTVAIPYHAGDLVEDSIVCELIKKQSLPPTALVRWLAAGNPQATHPWSYWQKFCGIG